MLILVDCHFTPQDRSDGFIKSDIMKAFYKYYSNGSREIECVWKIQADNNMQIRLFMNHFRLGDPNQCSENFMEVYAGSTAGKPMKRSIYNTYILQLYVAVNK